LLTLAIDRNRKAMSTTTKKDKQVNVSEWIAHAIVDCGVKVVYGTLFARLGSWFVRHELRRRRGWR
jgi:hypothetical protein